MYRIYVWILEYAMPLARHHANPKPKIRKQGIDMKRTDFNYIWGVLLIAAGILFLLQTFGIMNPLPATAWEIVWGIAFAVGGLAFTWRFLSDRTGSWWAIIPGLTLLAISLLIGLSSLGYGEPGNNSPWLGALFLGAIALSFWIVYFTRPDRWWAVIPGGVLLTLAVVASISMSVANEVAGAMFFFGLAATFGIVYLLPTPHGRMIWALIPAGVLALLGVAVLLAFASAFNYVWSIALILVGVYLLFHRRDGGEIPRQG
jgi:hypothetical protein